MGADPDTPERLSHHYPAGLALDPGQPSGGFLRPGGESRPMATDTTPEGGYAPTPFT